MASVIKDKQKEIFLTEVGRCLMGYVDGKKKFKYADGERRVVKIRQKPSKKWIEDGWFSRDLLNDC